MKWWNIVDMGECFDVVMDPLFYMLLLNFNSRYYVLDQFRLDSKSAHVLFVFIHLLSLSRRFAYEELVKWRAVVKTDV